MSKEKPQSTMCSPTMATTKVCRLCGTKDVPFLNIFGNDMNLASQIEELLFIEVKEWDDLPHKICFRCSTKVTEFHEFLEKCVKTQGQFTKLLGKPYSFKRDKNTSARKNWEAKLNKSKLSNDEYCDELVKKALESAMSKPVSLKDEGKLKSLSSKTVLNGNFKHPSCTKDVKIILKRFESLNFPGIKITGNRLHSVSENLKQPIADPKSCNEKKITLNDENVNLSKLSNLIKYKCKQCNEVVEDKSKVTGHVCKTGQSKETPVNTVNPVKRSKAIMRNLKEVSAGSPCDVIDLDDDDCIPETTSTVKKNTKPDSVSNGKINTIQGKNFHLLDMLVPQPANDSPAKPTVPMHSGTGQIVPISLPPNCCLVPMADNTFTIQMIPQEPQSAMPVMQNSNISNFQNKMFSGGQYYVNNTNYVPSSIPAQQTQGEMGQFRNNNFMMPSIQNSHGGLRYVMERQQKYNSPMNPPSDQRVVPETICSDRSTRRKSSSKISDSRKIKQSTDSSGPYPVSLLYRNTQDEHNTAEAVQNDSFKSTPNMDSGSKRAESSVYTILPPKNSDNPVPSSSSKRKDSLKTLLKNNLKKKKYTSTPVLRNRDTSQGAVTTREDVESQPQVTDGSFFTVVNVEPFFKPGNVPPMKICLKKSTASSQPKTITVPVTFESSMKSSMMSENLSKKNENTLYSCSICDLEFTREKRLLSHYKTHYEGFNDEEYL